MNAQMCTNMDVRVCQRCSDEDVEGTGEGHPLEGKNGA